MNISNFAHAGLALLAQALIGLSTGNWWAGAAFGCAFYFGREVAQHEQHRISEHFKLRALMPWYEGFKVFKWSTDAKFDLIIPTITVCIIAIIVITLI